MTKLAIHHIETHELLGYAVEANGTWQAQTVFGYTIARAESQQQAEAILRERGLAFLLGVWRYYDKQANDWYPCVLQEVFEHQVTVIRTTEMGYQDPAIYKRVTLQRPDESVLIKS